MRRIVLILILLSSFIGFGQSDCEEILHREINYDLNIQNIERFKEDLSLLKNCGFDDGDILIMKDDLMLGLIINQLITKKSDDSAIKFQDLYNEILEIKQQKDYEFLKNYLLVSNELSQRPADINNWEKDKVLLRQLTFSDNEVGEFHDYLKEHSNPNRTYKEVFAEYQENQQSTETISELTDDDNYWIFRNAGNIEYENLLKESARLGKPLLIYFTGYADVNSRKMETFLFDESIIEKLKNDFYFVSLYVDDKASLPENEKSLIDGRLIKTIGGKLIDLQKSKFKTDYQPYFVIVDKDGNILKEQGYTNDTELFKDFLNIGN